jgi:hypothetical protein
MKYQHFLPLGFVHASECLNKFSQASLESCDRETQGRKQEIHSSVKTKGSLLAFVIVVAMTMTGVKRFPL